MLLICTLNALNLRQLATASACSFRVTPITQQVYKVLTQMEDDMTADELRTWRLAQTRAVPIDQREAAQRLGVTLRAYRGYEQGDRPVPQRIEVLCSRPPATLRRTRGVG